MVALIFPLLYSRAVKEALATATSTEHPARAYSYQDDLDIVHHPTQTAQTSVTFHSACKRIGLRANTSKETITPGREVPPSSIPLGYAIDTDPKVLKHGQRALPAIPSQDAQPGSQLPSNAPEVERLGSERVTFLSRLVELKESGLAVQDAMHLAKTRTSGDFVFLARTVGIPQTDARELDDTLRQFVARLTGVDETTLTDLLFLPQAMGGYGFSGIEHVSRSANAASWYENLPRVTRKVTGNDNMAQTIAGSRWLTKITRSVDLELTEILGEPGNLLGDRSKHVPQKELTKKINEKRRTRLIEDLPPEGKAVRLSAASKGAAAWMCAPCHPTQVLSDPQFKIACLRRANAVIPGQSGPCQHRQPDGTPCGEELDPQGNHAAACRTGGWRVRKHDTLVKALGKWAEDLGCDVRLEQNIPTANSNSEARLDLIVHHENLAQPALIDVTIVNSAAAEYISKGAASREGAAASAAEQAKRNKYPGIYVTPFVLEEHGHIGDSAVRFIKTIAPSDPAERSRAINDIYRRISGIIQKVSADAIMTAMRTTSPRAERTEQMT